MIIEEQKQNEEVVVPETAVVGEAVNPDMEMWNDDEMDTPTVEWDTLKKIMAEENIPYCEREWCKDCFAFPACRSSMVKELILAKKEGEI